MMVKSAVVVASEFALSLRLAIQSQTLIATSSCSIQLNSDERPAARAITSLTSCLQCFAASWLAVDFRFLFARAASCEFADEAKMCSQLFSHPNLTPWNICIENPLLD